MTDRKFYRTVITLEVLSEEGIPPQMSFEEITSETMAGRYSGAQIGRDEFVIDGKQAAEALKSQASDPGFFNLTDSGEDADE